VSQLRAFSRVGSGLLAAAVSSAALAAPVSVAPGDNNISVPAFSGSTPTVSVLFMTTQTESKGGITMTLEEWALHTSLNPGAITIAFDITTSVAATSLAATLKGYGHVMTSVETCDPFQTVTLCGTPTGTVSRSSGAGEMLTFSGLATTAVPPPPGGTSVNATNLYGIFTDASGFRMNSPVQIKDGSTTFSFTKGIAPSGSASVPEPATFGLLGLGLLGSLLGGRRRASPGRAQTRS